MGGKLNTEYIGDNGPFPINDRGSVVHFPLKGRSNLNRLHFCLKGSRKCPTDHSVQ
jgi:hypothetical protein